MVIVVTRDVADRFRGFLASVMIEVSPGTYVSPSMTKGVRERVWAVLDGWFREIGGGAITMCWRDRTQPGHLGLSILGAPPCTLLDADGVYLGFRPPASTAL
ncbi:type I-E CRISPR-associated endoribonuclease Cas2e [Zavarzinia compransoris]|uniref:Type I-E CRISPR-associated endoribonuclease Cas2 n=1 Tax=Zavarzinia compransoris TaxID=1264899 RepID=A0A317E0X8_9PROT|nr:type I-E CRISPR-associated endoribonuclease Cas2e [Zavarzinia compransoris]PWR18805.1 type I-E CRISPR-associated endoribonuclease Cas2 [Zavarzinia compransoris]TDP48792.1 CRISPR-associated protein Cas2 [Zavarzinia compransoris]